MFAWESIDELLSAVFNYNVHRKVRIIALLNSQETPRKIMYMR